MEAGFPPRWPGFAQVGFVVDKMALGQVFSEYFGFPMPKPFHSTNFSILTINRAS
jgi:hypothetical protein